MRGKGGSDIDFDFDYGDRLTWSPNSLGENLCENPYENMRAKKPYDCPICERRIPKGELHSHHIAPPTKSSTYNTLACSGCGKRVNRDEIPITNLKVLELDRQRKNRLAREKYIHMKQTEHKLAIITTSSNSNGVEDGRTAAAAANDDDRCKARNLFELPKISRERDKNIQEEGPNLWEIRMRAQGWRGVLQQ